MKNILILVALCLTVHAQAQVKKATPKKQAIANKRVQHKTSLAKNTKTTTLKNNTAHTAYASPADINRLRITDPAVLNTTGQNTSSLPTYSGSGIMGAPKGTYGFANGHLFLYSTGSTSIGGVTGSGSVGTGTSAGNVGVNGHALGVNGKSPFAASGIYGTRIPETSSVPALRPDTSNSQ